MPQDHPTDVESLRSQARAFRRRARPAQAHADALWKQAQDCDEKADALEAAAKPAEQPAPTAVIPHVEVKP